MFVMFAAIASLTLLGLALGFLLGLAARYLKVETDPVADKIESLLSGANCGQCGLPGCAPAAEALARPEPALPPTLHANLLLVDQPRGALVRRPHREGPSTRGPPERTAPQRGHPALHRGQQPGSQAAGMDQVGRRDLGFHRAFL
ncbi:MAG: hypothetical protein HC808_02590 [Candidatus Competibacteraceae bacterium]|nr:hypothetical protein [Candidatus Competibacteraceae bacterium]